MKTVGVNEARTHFSDLMARVAYGGQRVVIERRGKPLVAWISIEELSLLEAMDNEPERRRNVRALALADAAEARQRIEFEHGSTLLPESADVIASLREDRTDELSGLR